MGSVNNTSNSDGVEKNSQPSEIDNFEDRIETIFCYLLIGKIMISVIFFALGRLV